VVEQQDGPADSGSRRLLKVEDLSKSYGPIQALRGVSLDIRDGEVHGICGHNGAGKSTFVKILVGLVRPDAGALVMDGHELHLQNPQQAQAHGIAIVDQELSLVPALSVEDNVFLGSLHVPLLHRRRRLQRKARQLLDGLDLQHVPLSVPVDQLAIGERQLVEMARLLGRDARLLILDEPTATLSKGEIERVFRAVREVVSQGRSVIYVSHRLDEIFSLCDRVTVFRDGQAVGTHGVHELDRRSLIALILGEIEGEHVGEEPAEEHEVRPETAVEIHNLNVPGRVRHFSLEVKRGEIVGLAGQIGSGASEVLRALGGLIPEARGNVIVAGRRIRISSPRHALDGGVMYVSNDRQAEGLFSHQAVERNLTAVRLREISRAGMIVRGRARRIAARLAGLVGVAEGRLGSPVATLSGGNQQKVMLGRGLEHGGTVLLALDEPTRGVDIGGRADIHLLVQHAAAQGNAVIFASTEFEEVFELSDVIVTMFEGRIVSVVPCKEANVAAVLADMTTSRSPVGPDGSAQGAPS